MKTSQSTLKTEKTVMRDINDAPENTNQITEKEKTRFKRIKAFNSKREENTVKYPRLNNVLLIVFPVFICAMAEINQGKYITSFIKFAADRPSVIIFDLIII